MSLVLKYLHTNARVVFRLQKQDQGVTFSSSMWFDSEQAANDYIIVHNLNGFEIVPVLANVDDKGNIYEINFIGTLS